MFRRSLLKGVAAGSAATVLSSGTAHAQTPLRIRIQTAVPSASIYFELLKRMGDRVDKMSAGRVKMEMLPDGAVVAAFEILDAVDKGVVEGGYAWTHYWSGKNAAAGLFSNPMAGAGVGLDQLSHVAWIFEGGGYDLYRKLYKDVLKVNVEPLFVQPMGPDPLGWFKRPITSTEDFKKMKYRAPPGITGEIFKEMGVSAVALPGGEIVTAAQRGVIDAAEWIGPADDLNLGLQTVWKHYYLQGLHQSTDIGEVLINKTVWDKLSPDLQEIIRTAAMASMMETYTYNVYRNAQAIVRLRNEFKVEIHDTPKDFFPQFVRATNVVLDRYAAEGRFLQAGARLPAQFREDRRAVLDEDPRPVLKSRQCRARRTSAEVRRPARTDHSADSALTDRAPALAGSARSLRPRETLHDRSRDRREPRHARARCDHARRRPHHRVADPADGRFARVRSHRALRVRRADRVGVRHDVHAVRHVLHARLGVDAAARRPYPHGHVLRRLVAAPPGAGRRDVLRAVLPARDARFPEARRRLLLEVVSAERADRHQPVAADRMAVQVRDAADRRVADHPGHVGADQEHPGDRAQACRPRGAGAQRRAASAGARP